jgi:hypothetical protein
MKTDTELNTENFSAAGELGRSKQVCESSVVGPLGLEATTPAQTADAASEESSLATGAPDESRPRAAIAQLVELSVEAEKISSAAASSGDNQVGNSSVASASTEAAAVDPFGDALAALDRRDYATAQRLFEARGRKGAAAVQVKESASPIPAPPKPAASAGSPTRVEVIPFVEAADRQPLPHAQKAKRRGLKPLILRSGWVFFAIRDAHAIYGLPPNGSFAATKSQTIAGLASAVDIVKVPLEAITRLTGREEERSARRTSAP